MTVAKWIAAVPVAVLWLVTWPFAALHDGCAKALGMDQI